MDRQNQFLKNSLHDYSPTQLETQNFNQSKAKIPKIAQITTQKKNTKYEPTDDDAIAEPQPKVLKQASTIFPVLSSTLI